VAQVGLVAERHAGGLELAEPLHEHLAVGVDQDVRDLLVQEQRRDRAEVEGVVEQLGDEPLLVAAREPDLRLDQHAAREALDLGAALVLIETFEHRQVQLRDQLAMELLLDDLITVRFGLGGPHGKQGTGGLLVGVPAPEAVAEVHGRLPLSEQAHAAGSFRRNGPHRLFDALRGDQLASQGVDITPGP
jgi:hypothetical protein